MVGRAFLFLALPMAGLVAAGCEPTSPKPSVIDVLVAPDSATITQGQSLRMIATVTTNPSGSAYSVSWTSSDAQAATVDSTGLVLGVAGSPAVSICATVNTGSASAGTQACATLVVQPAPVCRGPTGSLIPSVDTIQVGDMVQFQIPTAQLAGRSAGEIRWTIYGYATPLESPEPARVDSLTGVVTGVSATGTTNVIATDPLLTSPCPHIWEAIVTVR